MCIKSWKVPGHYCVILAQLYFNLNAFIVTGKLKWATLQKLIKQCHRCYLASLYSRMIVSWRSWSWRAYWCGTTNLAVRLSFLLKKSRWWPWWHSLDVFIWVASTQSVLTIIPIFSWRLRIYVYMNWGTWFLNRINQYFLTYYKTE